VSVNELIEQWKYIEDLDGKPVTKIVPADRMPPWHEICTKLNWDLHTVDGGYFDRKRYGSHGAIRHWSNCAALRSKFPSSKLGIAIFFTGVDVEGWVESDLIRGLFELLRGYTAPKFQLLRLRLKRPKVQSMANASLFR
jgi:hypothetical protein